MQSQNQSRQAFRDFIILALVLLAANFLIGGSADPGWVWLNPCPYLLLPALLGGRYGFVSGIVGAIGACACIVVAEFWLGEANMDFLIHDRPFLLVSTFITAVIAGEMHRYLRTKRDGIESENELLKLRCDNLERSLGVSREAQHMLQQQLALQGSELCSFDLELQRLFHPEAGPLLPATLDVINRFTGITDAAFYSVGTEKGKLKLEARLGSAEALPEKLSTEEHSILRAVLDSGKMITCKDIWKETPKMESRFLAVLPWKNKDGKTVRLLLVHRMPFVSVNWQNFARLELICDWVAAFDQIKANRPQGQAAHEVGEGDFEQFKEMAANAAARHSLPSTVLLFAASLISGASGQELRNAIVPHLRGSDLFTVEDSELPRLSILLPMEGKRDAGLLTDAVLSALPDANLNLEVTQVPISGNRKLDSTAG